MILARSLIHHLSDLSAFSSSTIGAMEKKSMLKLAERNIDCIITELDYIDEAVTAKVAEKLNFLEKGEGEPTLASPIPDYTMPGIKNDKLATAVAGIIGTLIVFGFSYGIAALIRQRKNQ